MLLAHAADELIQLPTDSTFIGRLHVTMRFWFTCQRALSPHCCFGYQHYSYCFDTSSNKLSPIVNEYYAVHAAVCKLITSTQSV